jgi:hypothetical protein
VRITQQQLDEIREHLEAHNQDGDCGMTGCCAAGLIEFLEELLE